MASSSSISLLQTMEWAKKFNFGRSSALGNFLEPSMTSANTILQTILGPPFAWRWNRTTVGFIATAGQQDYTLFNWSASTPVKSGWVLVDSNGNSQSVTTAGTTTTAIPSFNNTKGGTTNDGTAVWTNLGSIGVPVATTYSFGWTEVCSVQDTSQSTPPWVEMESQICLGLDSAQSRPRYLAAQGDDGNGNITFRLMPVPDAAYPVAITMQQNPPLFTSVQQTWAPVPDEFSRIFNWGFLSLMWLFADDPRFSAANSKFVAQLLAANDGLTDTERNIFLNTWQSQTGQPVENQTRMGQGTQARQT